MPQGLEAAETETRNMPPTGQLRPQHGLLLGWVWGGPLRGWGLIHPTLCMKAAAQVELELSHSCEGSRGAPLTPRLVRMS